MNKNSNYVKKSVENLREYATRKGLKVVFRNHPTNTGDFCFFIYKMSGGSYLVGYDGCCSMPASECVKGYSFSLCS